MKLVILEGDIFTEIKKIPDNSINLTITSPPYWGMRSYHAGNAELGQEKSMEEYLDNMIKWVHEVWRITSKDGSLVLNLGDCFIGGGRGGGNGKYLSKTSIMNDVNVTVPEPPKWSGLYDRTNKNCSEMRKDGVKGTNYYKPKQLLSVSSFAYCRIVSETDFVCRGEHIQCKPNVPSPIRRRLKHSHEKLFWFVKDADEYYFNPEPWLHDVTEVSHNRGKYPVNMEHFNTGAQDKETKAPVQYPEKTIEHSWRIVPVGEKQKGFELSDKKQNEHVAPFPSKLIEPYIQSLCPPDGMVCDPFMGSFTTMRVAMENGRSCVGIELNPSSIKYGKLRCNWGAGLGIEYRDSI